MKETAPYVCESAELYALGGLSEKEKVEFESHLEACPSCQEKLNELSDLMDVLPFAAEPVEVPSGMKKRILNNILQAEEMSSEKNQVQALPFSEVKPNAPKTEPMLAVAPGSRKARTAARGTWWNRVVMGGLSAAVFLLGIYSFTLREQIKGLENQLALVSPPNQATEVPLQTDQAVVLSPAAEDIVASGLATIVVDQKGTHLIVQAKDLPELQGTEAFQVWLLKDGTPHNAGTFVTDNGNGALYFTFEPGEFDTVAITHEPDAFGDQPRGKVVLAAPLETSS